MKLTAILIVVLTFITSHAYCVEPAQVRQVISMMKYVTDNDLIKKKIINEECIKINFEDEELKYTIYYSPVKDLSFMMVVIIPNTKTFDVTTPIYFIGDSNNDGTIEEGAILHEYPSKEPQSKVSHSKKPEEIEMEYFENDRIHLDTTGENYYEKHGEKNKEYWQNMYDDALLKFLNMG